MPNVVRTMFKALGTLSPEDLLPQIPAEDSYYKTLIAIGGLMRTYVIDSDHQLMEAWKLYALAMARVAIMEVDPIKDDFLRMQHVEDSQFLLQKAVHSSRKLLRAMFRLESFHIFLLGHTAAAHRVKMQDLSFEFIRPNFQPALELYEIGMNTFDLLAFSIIPNLEAMIRKPQGRGFSLKQSQRKLNQTAEEVALLAVSLGNWAKTGFLTIWSILQQCSSPLRIFILGDPPGLLEWQKAATELSEQEDHEMLKGVSFEYIDFEKHPKFIEYLQQYPHQDCSFGAAGKAILARAVCHLVLPPQISKIISMDLGDVLAFDDLRSLWQQFQHMEDHHVLAASHAVALSHINAGVVLYHVERMRLVGFERLALRAVEDMQRWKADSTCLRDQSIINILHSFRSEFGYLGPSPVMILPCRWSVFPTTEWLSYWNSPEMWMPELRRKRRYPGIVSVTRVEVFCPDEMDIFSAWAFLPMTDDLSRHQRLRAYSLHEGHKKERYCSADRTQSRCCACGEPVSLLHIAGDMKNWPAMQALLRAYLPPFKDPPRFGGFEDALSREWTGGEERLQEIQRETTETAVLAAKMMGLQALFGHCATLKCQASRASHLDYVLVPLQKLSLPVKLEVETTALSDAHLLLGIESHSGLELVINGGVEKASCLRWVRSAPGSATAEAWSIRREIMCIPRDVAMVSDGEGGTWMRFSLFVGSEEGLIIVTDGAQWGNYLPEEPLKILKSRNDLTISVGTFYNYESRWSVCLGDAEGEEKIQS